MSHSHKNNYYIPLNQYINPDVDGDLGIINLNFEQTNCNSYFEIHKNNINYVKNTDLHGDLF